MISKTDWTSLGLAADRYTFFENNTFTNFHVNVFKHVFTLDAITRSHSAHWLGTFFDRDRAELAAVTLRLSQ